jgi:hypothetical protein
VFLQAAELAERDGPLGEGGVGKIGGKAVVRDGLDFRREERERLADVDEEIVEAGLGIESGGV